MDFRLGLVDGSVVALAELPGIRRLATRYAVALFEDADGQLWVGSSGQLLRWPDDSHRSYFLGSLARFETGSSASGVTESAVTLVSPVMR